MQVWGEKPGGQQCANVCNALYIESAANSIQKVRSKDAIFGSGHFYKIVPDLLQFILFYFSINNSKHDNNLKLDKKLLSVVNFHATPVARKITATILFAQLSITVL